MCVVDLDTVMPGLVPLRFRDMVRTTTSPTMEDEKDLAKDQMQCRCSEALARVTWRSPKHPHSAERRYPRDGRQADHLTIGIRS